MPGDGPGELQSDLELLPVPSSAPGSVPGHGHGRHLACLNDTRGLRLWLVMADGHGLEIGWQWDEK